MKRVTWTSDAPTVMARLVEYWTSPGMTGGEDHHVVARLRPRRRGNAEVRHWRSARNRAVSARLPHERRSRSDASLPETPAHRALRDPDSHFRLRQPATRHGIVRSARQRRNPRLFD